MTKDIQEPTVNERGQKEHPAYGQISAHRVSGGIHLFGSDFQHKGFVRIRIAQALLNRDLSRDWVFAPMNGFVEVDMSEAQWAHFVSSMNAEGTLCTISTRENRDVPALPAPEPRHDQFRGEMMEMQKKALDELKDLTAAIESSGLSKTKMDVLKKHAAMTRQHLVSNVSFVASSFDKHMEKTTTHAQMEVDAYLNRTIQRIGLQAIEASGMPVPALLIPKDES